MSFDQSFAFQYWCIFPCLGFPLAMLMFIFNWVSAKASRMTYWKASQTRTKVTAANACIGNLRRGHVRGQSLFTSFMHERTLCVIIVIVLE